MLTWLRNPNVGIVAFRRMATLPSGGPYRMSNERSNTAAQVGQSDSLNRELYERHLLIDKVVDWAGAGPHERFEAFAIAVREILAQRWVETESTYVRENPKRVYYLSIEFLIGRSLANNVENLLLGSDVRRA